MSWAFPMGSLGTENEPLNVDSPLSRKLKSGAKLYIALVHRYECFPSRVPWACNEWFQSQLEQRPPQWLEFKALDRACPQAGLEVLTSRSLFLGMC